MTGRWAVIAALAGHWRRRPLQLVAVLAGLTVATALWSGVQALNAEARGSYAEAAALIGADENPRLEPAPEVAGRIDRDLYVALRRAGWAVSPVIEGRVRVGTRRHRLIGIEPLTLPQGRLTGALAGGPGIGAFATPPWTLVAHPDTLAELGIAEDARAETADGVLLPPAVASARLAPGVLVTDIGAAERILGPNAGITALVLDADAPEPETDWREIAEGRLVLVPAGGETDLERLTDSFHLNLTAFAFLAFAVGLFITHSAVGLAFEQRLGMIRTLRACGVSAAGLTLALGAETLAAALIAGAAGLAIGYAIAGALLPDVAATLGGLYGADVDGVLGFDPVWALAGLAMSVAGAAIAAGNTLWRAWSMPPLASARREAWHGAQMRALRGQTLAGLALLMLSAMVWRAGEGLTAGFVVMGTLLTGATLLLPVVLAAALEGLRRLVRGPVVEWAVADARQQVSGLGLALMALLLALAANVGVGTMVESFRTTFVDWLDRRLLADAYIDPRDAAQAAEIAAWLSDRPDVAAVLETRRLDAEIGGLPVGIVGRPAAETYRRVFPFLSSGPDAWDRIAAGEGAMVSEQLARRLGLSLGETIRLPAPEGTWRPEVVAIYADYGNPQGQVGVGRRALIERWPDARPDGTGVVMADGAAPGPLLADLDEAFGIGPEAARDTVSLKRFSLGVFEQTFAVTAMLNVLTLAVAGVAMFLSLLTLADLRLVQVAPLWAVGITRQTLAAADLAKTVGLAALTWVAALPLGLAVAWLLVAVINVEAFGWRLPLYLFPGQWAWLAALTVAVAAAASAVPSARLARMAPARLVKVFAEER